MVEVLGGLAVFFTGAEAAFAGAAETVDAAAEVDGALTTGGVDWPLAVPPI